MNLLNSRRVLFASLLIIGLLCLKSIGFAQEVTYYDFDAPNAANAPGAPTPGNGSSLTCGDPAKGTLTTPNPLFCFNNGGGSNPGFLSDIYPASINPDPTSPTHYTVQITPSAAEQAASMWFSVPQKVVNGFTSYFAFRFTPDPTLNSFATADGIAFVIQNAAGGGSETNIFEPACAEIGSGPNAVGGNGGCMGYGGLDNSLAFELDTYKNNWDPADSNASTYNASKFNDNHIAVQHCGPQSGNTGNSPDHTGPCLVQLLVNNALQGAINGQLGVTMADGNVHQVVIQYSGPTEATPNLLQIFIDPPFVSGTHTPTANAVPAISGTYDISANLNLMNGGSANDSAYVGFTSATGGAFEQHELLAWTFTPHSPVTQQQPLSPPGQPTTFPFGAHTYAVTYPVGGPDTGEIDMVVTANTITPALFSQLITGTSFAGSVCQVYDETGGNCIVYSTSCVTHGTNTIVECPATTDDSNPIVLKSAYNNTIQPTSPGFLKGDPFYSLLTTITGDGTTATVTCLGECSVTVGQTITIAGNLNGTTPSAFNGPVTVVSANALNSFTFASASTVAGTGGYITSNNLSNAFTGYVTQKIDGTTSGKTKNFSDFVVTSVTNAVTSISITAPSIVYGNSGSVGVTVSSGGGTPTGTVSLTVDGGSPITQPLSSGPATFTIPGLSAGIHQLLASYAPTVPSIFQASTQPGTLTVTQASSVTTITADTPNPAATGSPVTIAFTVTGAGTPTGTYSVTGGAGDPTCSGSLVSGAGSCSLTFLTPGTRTVTVVYSGDTNFIGSQTSVQQSVSGPLASVSPGSINFGTLYLGTLSIKSVTLTNVGSAPMTIKEKFLSIVGGGNSNEFVALSLCPSTLNAGKSCAILVTFVAGPTYNATQTATLMINDSAPGSPQSVTLSGNVINPQASFSPSSLNFGTQTKGTPVQSTVTITNSGNTPLTITSFGISGANASDFTQVSNTCSAPVAAKASCTTTLKFTPAQTGNRNAILTVYDNVWNGSQQVALTGKGK
jgi:Bacterial lectin/Bacterial Ig-like domain (group 3)/Abnormal spindle-like microcephaly-assoc'd, ASPM-SPD-2-Hydin